MSDYDKELHEKETTTMKLFENKKIRTAWNEEEEEWYFSIVDVCGILTDSPNPNNYWKVLKKRLKEEGNESVTNCNQLKLSSLKDGKKYLTDVANAKQLLRIIQSVPSPKAEPFKLWLATVGSERLEEMTDPEQAIHRALSYYKRKGYSDSWINQRLKSIEVRKDLTDEWKRSGVTGKEYALLTDEISSAWSDMTTKEYKQFKGLKKENLRDNMTNLELILTMLAEASTTEISKIKNPFSFEENQEIAQKGGHVAKSARENLEQQTGCSVITQQNSLYL